MDYMHRCIIVKVFNLKIVLCGFPIGVIKDTKDLEIQEILLSKEFGRGIATKLFGLAKALETPLGGLMRFLSAMTERSKARQCLFTAIATS